MLKKKTMSFIGFVLLFSAFMMIYRAFLLHQKPTCYFDVVAQNGHPVPVDRKDGEVIGFLQRGPDGTIYMTTHFGSTSDVTECLDGKLTTEQHHSLPLYN